MFAARLINFKCFPDRTFTIPTGINLLSAPNASGKTTLLNAISFALYEEDSGIYPWKGKQNQITSVDLTFPNGFRIYRQRRPNLLRIIYNNILYENQEATVLIDNLFGSRIGWLSSSYIQQLTICHFLTMSSADKLDFLQKLFLPNPERYEQLLQKTTYLVTQANEQFNFINVQRQVKEGLYLNTYNSLSPEVLGTQLWSNEDRENFLTAWGDFQNHLTKTHQEINKLEKKLSEIEIIKSNNQKIREQLITLEPPEDIDLTPISDELLLAEKQLTLAQGIERRNQLLITRSHFEDLLSKLPDLEKSEFTLSEVERRENMWSEPISQNLLDQINLALKLQEQIKITNQIKDLDALLNNLPDKFNPEELKDLEKLIVQLEHQSEQFIKNQQNISRVNDLIQKIKLINLDMEKYSVDYNLETHNKIITQKQELETQLARFKYSVNLQNEIQLLPENYDEEELSVLMLGHTFTCPGCSLNLAIKDGNLVKVSTKVDPLKREERKRFLMDQRSKCQRRKQLEHSLSEIGPVNDCSNEYSKISEQKLNYDEMQKKHKSYRILSDQKAILEKNLEFIQGLIENVSNPVEEIKLARSQKENLLVIQKNYIKRLELEKQKQALKEKISDIPEQENSYLNYSREHLLKLQRKYQELFDFQSQYPKLDFELEKKKIQNWAEKQNYLNAIQKINSELENTPPESEEVPDFSFLQNKIQDLKDKFNQGSQQKTLRTQILAQISSLTSSIQKEESIDEYQVKLQDLRKFLDQILIAQKQLEVQNQLLNLSQLYLDWFQTSQMEQKLQTRISKLTKIKTVLNVCEYTIMDTILSKINGYLEIIINEIFNEPISIHLSSLRKLKTTDRIKPEIHLDINYKGAQIKPIDLSGGQYAKVSLGLMLAFSRMSKYPFILLDECFNAIDSPTRSKIIELIRRYFPEKTTIVICHDSEEGIYDSIIRI